MQKQGEAGKRRKERPPSWSLLAVAPSQPLAETWADLLRQEGIPAMLQPQDAISFLGVTAFPCRLLVPGERLGEARNILSHYLEPQPPAP